MTFAKLLNPIAVNLCCISVQIQKISERANQRCGGSLWYFQGSPIYFSFFIVLLCQRLLFHFIDEDAAVGSGAFSDASAL